MAYIDVESDRTIEAGEVRHATFVIHQDASLFNYGKIISEGTGIVGDGGSYPTSVVWNEAGALFKVLAVDAESSTWGMFASDGSPSFRNDGVFKVLGQTGDTYGLYLGAYSMFQNSGDFSVVGEGRVFALAMTQGSFTNSGHVHVAGATRSLAVDNFSSFHNTGVLDISDKTDAIDSVAAEAIDQGHVLEMFNSGTIRGDYAIVQPDTLYGGTVDLDNQGRIEGLVKLGDAGDLVHNSGVMTGAIQLGGGDDLYDGVLGRELGGVLAGDGDDVLTGGRGADAFDGGLGQDRLQGGLGADDLTGGGGADVFVYAALQDSFGLHGDLIHGLQASDLIDLSAIDADIGTAGDQAFALASQFTGAAGEMILRYSSHQDRTLLEGDVDGDGKADLVIALEGDHRDFNHFVL